MSDGESIGAIPKSWRVAPLSELCAQGKDSIVDGPFGSNLKRSDFLDSGIPVLKLQNIKPNLIVQKNMDYVSLEKYEEIKRHSFCLGDIVMTKLGDPLGVSAIVTDIDFGVIVADLVRVRPRNANTKFLCYQLNSPLIAKHLNDNQKGTTRPRINLSIVRELKLNVPPLDEQVKIVEILEEQLSHLDAAMASVHAVRDKAARFRRSLLHAAFTGELSGHVLSEKSLPDGWRQETISDIANGGLFVDGDWVESKDQDPSGNVRLTQLADVGEGVFRNRSNRWMREDQAKRIGVTYLREGDLLIARMPEPLGRCCLVPPIATPSVTVVDVAVLRPDQSQYDSRYVMWMLNSPEIRQAIERESSGTTRVRISRKNLGSIRIPMPPISEQKKIVGILEEQLLRLDASLKLANVIELKASALKRSLLHSAFTGVLTKEWREGSHV